MKLVLFVNAGASLDAHRVGVLSADGATVSDVTAALQDAGHGAMGSMRKFLELGAEGRAVAEAATKNAVYTRAIEMVKLRAPIYDWCVRAGVARGVGECASGAVCPPDHHPTHPPPAPATPSLPAARSYCAWA